MMHAKLVRDKIPEIIKSDNTIPIIRVASKEEYWEKLKEKLKEEVEEFLKDESEEELVDILEVIYALCDFKGIERECLERMREKKAEERGSFKGRIILEGIKKK